MADSEPAQIAPASVLTPRHCWRSCTTSQAQRRWPRRSLPARRSASSTSPRCSPKLADAGADPEQARRELLDAADDQHALVVEPLTDADSVEVARLRPITREWGLSLADRACLALAKRLAVPVLTADRTWPRADLEVAIRLIR